MPSYTRNKKRENVIFVAVNPVIRFGWKSKDLASISGISQSDLTNDLGHLAQNTVTGSGLILVVGAQAPKPARVTKRLSNASALQQQSVSTFCAQDKLAAAIVKGWNLSKNRRSVMLRASNAARGSLTAIATLSNGTFYCFPMNKADFEAYGAELGLDQSTKITNDTERNKLVSGSSKPRPGRASKRLDDGSIFSSFYSTATDVAAAKYDILSEEIVLTAPTGGGGGGS